MTQERCKSMLLRRPTDAEATDLTSHFTGDEKGTLGAPASVENLGVKCQ
jgi:hypothetical protein